ncbi:GAL4-like Zn(II)2Cys6 (or C6 zinc) binuclear cluster DNA-binding domain, partial [Rhizoctonia solani]
MQEVKTTRKRLPKRGAHARALAAAAAAESRELDIDDDEMSHTVLQRGSACLSCRKRKLKCDAVRPACRKCTTAGRADECHYDDGKQKTRTQLLQEKVKELEEKLKSLESGSNGSDEGDSMLSPDQPPALAPAIVSLSNGTISPNGQASEQLSGGYGRGLFEDPPVNERTHYDALLNRDTGTLQVFNQQEHSGNLLDVANGQAPPWLGEFSNFETSSGSKTVDTDFAGIPLAGTSDGGLERQLTAYLNGSSLSSGTNVGFSSMPSTSGQPAAPSQFIDITASYGVVPDPALSFTLDAFPDIDGVPARWLDQDHLPTHIRNYLIDLFMPHRHRCGFEVHIGRFLASLDLPINKRPHPCLMNAIYLLGCHYAPGGSLSHLEPLFLSRARTALAESLEHADRLKDFLFASALLACYFYFKGRLLEGQHHNSAGQSSLFISTTRETTECEFASCSVCYELWATSNKFPGMERERVCDNGDRKCPMAGDVYEPKKSWINVGSASRAGSLGTGLPHAIKDDEITTVFPRPLQEFEEGTVTNDTNATITNMYEDGNHAQDATGELHWEERDKKFWGEFWATDRALERIAQTLPHIHSGMGINDTSSLIFVHTFVQGSTIQLHLPFVETDSGSYDRSVKAADAAMNVVHMIDNIDAKNFHMLMGLSWICVSDILKREIRRKRGIADDEGARRTERELEALFAAMKRLRQVYPVLGVCIIGSGLYIL